MKNLKVFGCVSLIACALVSSAGFSLAQEVKDAEEAKPEMVKEAVEDESEAVNTDPTYDERLELAKKMHDLRPVRDQVENAIAQFSQTRPPAERETFKVAMMNVFNVKALEKISIDAYVDTFTVEELRAMVEYYSKPEAASASDKLGNYSAIVYPEIVRMLDKAAMRVRTGK